MYARLSFVAVGICAQLRGHSQPPTQHAHNSGGSLFLMGDRFTPEQIDLVTTTQRLRRNADRLALTDQRLIARGL